MHLLLDALQLLHVMADLVPDHVRLREVAGRAEALAQKLANPPAELDGLTVREVNKTDGVKLIFDDSTWLLFRLSGTEPVARVYAEACSPKDLKNVLDAGKKLVLSS